MEVQLFGVIALVVVYIMLPALTGAGPGAESEERGSSGGTAGTGTGRDPMDTRQWMRERGWELNGDVWWGEFEADGTSMRGFVMKTASGRCRAAISRHAPEWFREAAHNGNCLMDGSAIARGADEIHFEQAPETLGDCVEKVEEMLRYPDRLRR